MEWYNGTYLLPWIGENPGKTALIIGSAGVLLYHLFNRKYRTQCKRLPEGAVQVGIVSRVALYPVKSAKKMAEVDCLLCDRMGMRSNDQHKIRDRSWMVALEGGTMISQRAEPKLALVQPSFTPDGDHLLLNAPGMETLRLSTSLTQYNSPVLDVNIHGLHSDAVNCGKEAADWLCKFLGKKGFILVYHPPSMVGRRIIDGPTDGHKLFRPDSKVAYAEVAPVLLLTESTVKDVDQRVDGFDITESNFRPNIYINDTTEPYEEDRWDKVYIGDNVVLEKTILAPRCLLINVDQESGVMDKNKTLMGVIEKYRPRFEGYGPCIGIYMCILHDGEVKVGDVVYATRK